jgi:hypothetical protein
MVVVRNETKMKVMMEDYEYFEIDCKGTKGGVLIVEIE